MAGSEFHRVVLQVVSKVSRISNFSGYAGFDNKSIPMEKKS